MSTVLVGMADLNIAKAPDVLTTLGLGSCVGVTLYDPTRKIAGMVHVMLPFSNGAPGANRAKFADTGIVDLINKMTQAGASRASLVAKLAGGAHMFGTQSANSILNVGDRNAEACTKVLTHLRIPIKATDTGGRHGRTIELDAATGSLKIKTVGFGESYI